MVKVSPSSSKGTGYRGRAAHEVQHSSQWTSSDWTIPDLQDTSISWDEWLCDNDPIEMLAEQTFADTRDDTFIPEQLARDLVGCFNTHRENRQKLAKAVQARGYYVRGKGKGKGGDRGAGRGGKKGNGKGGKSSGKNRARGGLSLQELKAKTACAECGAVGHWKDECPNRKSNLTHHTEYRHDEPDEAEWQDYEGRDEREWEWDDADWDFWHFWKEEAQSYVPEASRSSHAASRPLKPQTDEEAANDPETLAEIRELKRKAMPSSSIGLKTSSPKTAAPKQVKQVRNIYVEQNAKTQIETEHDSKDSLFSDEFLDTSGALTRVKAILTNRPAGTTFSGSEAYAAIRTHAASSPSTTSGALGDGKSVWDLLKEPQPGPNLDELRRKRDVLTLRRLDFDTTSTRSAMSLTRRPPTVDPDKIYLTIDTACENTVIGSVYLEKVLQRLGAYGIMPLADKECEQYCFGPGAPKTSTMRLSVPLGIDGRPMIVRTSVIQEDAAASNRVPFLAGQDWLVMMKAVIDLGNNRLSLPAASCEVPLYIDVSGHMVICIEDYPCTGWPPGLSTTLDQYPGAIFNVSNDTNFLRPEQQQKGVMQSDKMDLNMSQIVMDHNYVYEPNDDVLNPGVHSRGPCTLPNDYWEYMTTCGAVVRHHRRPRRHLFDPEELDSGPGTQNLQPTRLTIVAGSKPREYIWDTWPTPPDALCPPSLECWVGKTYFFLQGFDPHKIKIPVPTAGTAVKFDDGAELHVAPNSLKPRHNKKILQFDFNSRPPIFEHESTIHKDSFRIPEGQFGSRLQAPSIRSLPHASSSIDKAIQQEGQAQPGGMLGAVGTPCHEDGHAVEHAHEASHHQYHGPRVQAQGTSIDGLHGGHDRSGTVPPAPIDFATFDDGSSGPDGQGDQGTLPGESQAMPTRRGGSTSDRECTRTFQGVHSVRTGDEGPAGQLHDPDHPRGSHRLWHHTRGEGSTRRKSASTSTRSAAGHNGALHQLGRVLLALIATAFCYTDPAAQQVRGPSFETLFEDDIFGPGRIPPAERLGLGVCGDGDGRLDPLPDPAPLRPGTKKRLKHSARRALQNSRTARELVAQKVSRSTWPRRKFGYDLIEIFGGTSMISIRAVQGWNLRVLQPIDIRYGINLRRRIMRRWLLQKLRQWNPRLAIVEMPCTPWSILQRNVNYRDYPFESTSSRRKTGPL